MKYFPFFGFIKTISWDSLSIIYVETTNKGPLFDDQFIVLKNNKTKIKMSLEFFQMTDLGEYIFKLEGFDNDNFIASLSSTENATFLCWEKLSVAL